jgi:cell fate regulator YaaT (PSP1 superfamily)
MDAKVMEEFGQSAFVIGVRFMPVGKIYHFDASAHRDLRKGDWVIVNTARGRQMGEVALLEPPKNGEADGPFKPIERAATNRDLAVRHYWTRKETEAMVIGREKVQQSGLPIKVVRAEYAFDGSRLSLLYTNEDNKLNLGPLTEELQRAFKAKVDMRLIGPRDAAKIIGGGGACGLDTRCCSMFLTDFSPISIKMAKEQGISLNPTEITGMCGRLRCCLIYEYEQYVAARKLLPKRGKEVGTPHGAGKVIDLLPLKESALILVGEMMHVVHRDDIQPLAELEAFQRKAASPCGEGAGCTCGHSKKKKHKDKGKDHTSATEHEHGESEGDAIE